MYHDHNLGGKCNSHRYPLQYCFERLLGKGIALTIHDPDLAPDKLVGANAAYVAQHLPHLKMLLQTDLNSAAAHAQTIVVAKRIKGLDELDIQGKTLKTYIAGINLEQTKMQKRR